MIKKAITKIFYPIIDNIYRNIDKKQIRRTRNIKLIPDFKNRRGGKLSYAEWAHVIGIFQTIFYQNVKEKSGNHVLDVGCGTGLLGIAAQPIVSGKGSYTGIDVMKYDINYCKNHFTDSNYSFIHFDIANPSYAATQEKTLKPWPVEDETKDLVTALSVWTHLCEEDAIYYFKEIARVLKKNGKAVITFFYLDEIYQNSLSIRKDAVGRFHSTNQMKWIYDTKAYESSEWYTTKWVKHPEDAIAISEEALNMILKESGLKLVDYHPGNWKEQPGVYFQDVLVFEK